MDLLLFLQLSLLYIHLLYINHNDNIMLYYIIIVIFDVPSNESVI